MRRPAALLLAAVCAAATLRPAPAAAEITYQQSSVDNRQSQTGDVLATGNLNVVVVDSVSSTSTATGNGYSASVQSGSLGAQSQQWVDANVTANNTVNVVDYAGQANMLTAATGNAGDINSLNYGDVVANVSQSVNTGRNVIANSTFTASDADIGGANISTQAIANSHGFALTGGSSDVTSDQWSGAITQATTTGDFKYTDGTATFSAAAMSNNVTVVGQEGADQKYDITQVMTGDRTQASVLVGAANAQTLNGVSSAIANNISATNAWHPLDMTTDQYNGGYVRAETDLYAYDFGTANANAYGVGNSVVAGNVGADLTMGVNQDNTGAVQSVAKFEGQNGYDASVTSIAMGNAATGYSCAGCSASKLNIVNRQSNSNLVSASSTVSLGGTNRSVTGVATAIGNSATYYISQPGS